MTVMFNEREFIELVHSITLFSILLIMNYKIKLQATTSHTHSQAVHV